MNNFVIVTVGQFEVEALAYFASTRAEAETVKAEAEAKHGVEFRIYSRR